MRVGVEVRSGRSRMCNGPLDAESVVELGESALVRTDLALGRRRVEPEVRVPVRVADSY